nr:hypothetical protein [Tanacetum cinerariifolium]
MTPAQALTAIQTMVDHSQKWHDGSSSKNIDSSSNSERIAAIVRKLDRLGRDKKKLKENVHVIQVGCQLCGGAHLEKECPLKKEVKSMEEVKYGEFGRPFPNNSRNEGFSDDESQEIDKSRMEEALVILDITCETKQVPQEEKQRVSYYEEPYEPPIPFLRRLEHHTEEALVHETMKSLKKIKINRPLLKEIRQTDNYAKNIKDLVTKKPKTEEDTKIRMNPRCPALLQNQLPLREQDLGSFILPCSIGRLDFNNDLADLGAIINIMPLSMYKRLGMGKLKPINMVIEMANNTKCTPKGIVENYS